VASGALDLAAVRRLWDAILDAVKSRSRTAHALMFSAQIVGLEGTMLTLSFPTATLATRFAADTSDLVTAAVKEVAGVDLVLRAVAADSPPTAGRGGGSRVPSAGDAGETRPSHVDLTAHDPDDVVDAADDDPVDPSDSALALLKEGLGAQVIGEIDRT
jgi:hypothetical protein